MPLTLVQGDITKFKNDSQEGYAALIFEDNLPKAKISSFCIRNNVCIRNSVCIRNNISIVITMRNYTKEMFYEQQYYRYQAIFEVFTEKNGVSLQCHVTLCNKSQFALLCEFITKHISSDFFETVKVLLPAAREDTQAESLFKVALQKLDKNSFEKLLSVAQKICDEKQNTYSSKKRKSWDAVWILGQTCLDKQLFEEAFRAFSLVPKCNWYRRSADFQLTNMLLENVGFLGLDKEKKHQKLKKHLITFLKEGIKGKREFEFGSLAWNLMALAGCTMQDFFGPNSNFVSMSEFKKFDTLLLKFADLHYQLQKRDPTFQPEEAEVSFFGLFNEEFSNSHLNLKDEDFDNEPSELTPEDWQIEGDFNEFINNKSNVKSLKFVNQSKSPCFFTCIELSEQTESTNSKDEHIATENRYINLYLPGAYENFPKAMARKYRKYNDIVTVVFYCQEQACVLWANVGGYKEERVKKFFNFLQNKIPTDILQKLKQYVVPRKPTKEETVFDSDLEKLDVEGKNFASLLKLAQKLCQIENKSLFRLGKKCMTLQLLDKAYQVFSQIYHASYHFDYKSQAHLEMSKILLGKMQIDSQKTEEDNHKQIGKCLVGYFEKNFDDQAWNILIEKLRMYAGLALTPKSKMEESLGLVELMLELAERIYLLKAKNTLSEKTDTTNSSLMFFSSNGQQVVDPKKSETQLLVNISSENSDQNDEENKKKKRTNWNSMK